MPEAKSTVAESMSAAVDSTRLRCLLLADLCSMGPGLHKKLVKLLFVVGCLLSTQATALTIHYAADRDERLLACDSLSYRGFVEDAVPCFTALTRSDEPLLRASAHAALGQVTEANRAFRDATSDSRDPAIAPAWGRLYLRTHQVSDAEALFREALLINPDYLPARLALAEAMASTFSGRARQALQELLAEFPAEPHALILLAGIELELQNLDVADELLDRALEATKAAGLPPLEVHALRAGSRLLANESIEGPVRAALAYNPRYGDVYAIPAHFYIITYRYREAVELYREAVALDPTLATAHRDLGINLLRIDELFSARYHLETAYQLDAFDTKTVNTLKLVDKLDGMRVSYIDVFDESGEELIGRALVRLDREDADALEPYVHELIERAMRVFTERYDFLLKKPMIVELYHDHDDFGVRTVSTPGIGLLGVTFGYLTAMDSPKARPAGDFHWGSTLWHEIAHVYTLEATNHRLPRWFSEGLSVYEEWNTGPLADRELPIQTLNAIAQDELLGIASLDEGFVRPSYQGQVQVSYMQAGLVCDFIASRWGHDALVTMLNAFARHASTEVALRFAIDLSADEFDAAFKEWLDIAWGDVVQNLEELSQLSAQAQRAKEFDDANSQEALTRELIRLYPERTGEGNAYEALAELQELAGDEQASLATLLEWQRRGGYEPAQLERMVGRLRALDRHDEAVSIAEALNWVMPYSLEIHAYLGQRYLEMGDVARAAREFQALLGLRPDDPANARYGLARAARAEGNPEDARREVLLALETSPFYRPAQRLLLELTEEDSE